MLNSRLVQVRMMLLLLRVLGNECQIACPMHSASPQFLCTPTPTSAAWQSLRILGTAYRFQCERLGEFVDLLVRFSARVESSEWRFVARVTDGVIQNQASCPVPNDGLDSFLQAF